MKQPPYPIFFDFIRFVVFSFLMVYSWFVLATGFLSRPRCPFRRFRPRREADSIFRTNHPDQPSGPLSGILFRAGNFSGAHFSGDIPVCDDGYGRVSEIPILAPAGGNFVFPDFKIDHYAGNLIKSARPQLDNA